MRLLLALIISIPVIGCSESDPRTTFTQENAFDWTTSAGAQPPNNLAGSILSKISGESLELFSDQLAVTAQRALNTASSSLVEGPTLSTTLSADMELIETTRTVSTYQCNQGGSVIHSVGNDVYSIPGETKHADSERYEFNDCVFFSGAENGENIQLRGTFETSNSYSAVSRSSQSTNSKTWTSFHQISTNSRNEKTEYFVDASINTQEPHTQTHRNNHKTVTIGEFEHINSTGDVESVSESSFQRDDLFSTNSGLREHTFQIEGIYKGPLTNQASVIATTMIPFDAAVSEFSFQGAPANVMAAGVFELSSTSSSLSMSMTGGILQNYHAATFAITGDAESQDLLPTELPFYFFDNNARGFAVDL